MLKRSLLSVILIAILTSLAAAQSETRNAHYITNRAPLANKPYTELPLGAIRPLGWLKNQLERMASGMSGHLDELYPASRGQEKWLAGRRWRWLGAWALLDRWSLAAGHILTIEADRQGRALGRVDAHSSTRGRLSRPNSLHAAARAEPGLQRDKRRDWWPKMVMLKVLQQHYMATGDQRVIDALTVLSLSTAVSCPRRRSGHWTFWGNRRGADNLMVVYWLYNVTGDPFLSSWAI